jgi:hypothetical protein
MLRMYGDVWVVSFVGKERRSAGGCTWSIVVSEFSEGKERRPVDLLVVAEYMEVLFECLIESFSLSVFFRMIAQGEVNLHVQCLPKGPEEVGNKLGSVVASNMRQDSVLEEYMDGE